MKQFSVAQASRLTGCSQHQIRYWNQINLVAPTGDAQGATSSAVYSFSDLVALRIVRSLLDGGMTLRQVRSAFEYLRSEAEFGDSDRVAGLKLVTDGRSIFEICRSDGEILDALKRGQLALFVAVDEINAGVAEGVRAFVEERDAFVANLGQGPGQVPFGEARGETAGAEAG